MDDWKDRLWYILIMEYYTTTRRNEVLIPAASWMGLENVMLSERIQTQIVIQCTCMIPFI